MSVLSEELSLQSPAKVNLLLSVHGPRDDGFHNLTSLVVALDFGDVLRVGIAETADTLVSTDPDLPTGPDNLILRAAAAFREVTGLNCYFSFYLEKNIPVGAGLGGGSGNAAIALQAMNRLCGEPLKKAALSTLAAQIGSDCCFFLEGRPALLSGRGDRVELLSGAIADRLTGRKVLIFKPDFSVSTAWAYGQLKTGGNYEAESLAKDRLENFYKGGAFEALLSNTFEPIISRKFIAIRVLLDELRSMGVPCLMSGSGSCCLALPGVSGLSVDAIKAKVKVDWGESVFFVETFIC